jgi:hypothetical protein
MLRSTASHSEHRKEVTMAIRKKAISNVYMA